MPRMDSMNIQRSDLATPRPATKKTHAVHGVGFGNMPLSSPIRAGYGQSLGRRIASNRWRRLLDHDRHTMGFIDQRERQPVAQYRQINGGESRDHMVARQYLELL